MKKISYAKMSAWALVAQYTQLSLTIVYGILLLPLYLKFIPAGMYGLWMATGNIMMWFGLLMPDWSQLLLQQLGSAYGADDKDKFSSVLCSGILISGAFASIFFLSSWLASSFFGSWLNLPEGFNKTSLENAFLLAAAGTALTAIGSTFGSVNLALHHTLADGFSNIVSMLIRLGVVLYCLFNGYGIYALGLGNLFFGITILIFNVVLSTRYLLPLSLRFSLDRNNLSSLASLTVYSSVNKIGNTFMKQIDYFLIARYIGGEAATMLRLVKVIPETLLLFATNASVALMPAISHSKGANSLKDKIEKIMQFTGVMFAFACYLGGGVFALEDVFISLWVNSPVPIEQKVVFLVVVNLVVAGIADTFGRYVFTIGEIKRISITRFIFSLFQMMFMFLGVLFWNISGMLVASILVYVSSAIVFHIFLVQAEQLSFNQWTIPLRGLSFGMMAAAIAAGCVRTLESSSWVGLFLSSIAYTIAFWIIITVISSDYRKFQRSLLSSTIKKITCMRYC